MTDDPGFRPETHSTVERLSAIETLRYALDKLDREEEFLNGRLFIRNTDRRDALAKLETLLQAAERFLAHDVDMPVLLDDRTYEDWADANRAHKAALAAAVRDVKGEA